jgi:hypothetical protein
LINLVILVGYDEMIIRRLNNLVVKDNHQSGFAMPLALGLGLVMIIVATTMIGRSQSDRLTTNSQRESSRATSVSEAGIVRVQSFLDRHKLLANKSLNEWTNTLNNLPSAQADCRSIDLNLARTQTELFKNHAWINLDDRDLNKGKYRIVDYQYQNGIGKLTIAGKIDAYNTNQNSANSMLAVEIPIGNESAKISPPALWANTFNLNPTQKITGQIRGVVCPQLSTVDLDGIVGIDSININLINGISTGQIIADPFTVIPAPKTVPPTAILIPAITTSIQFPRTNSLDLPDANNEYHYLVDLDNSNSGQSIKLQDIHRIYLDIPDTYKVNLYLKGNIDFGGSQTINVNTNHPNLRIYGSLQTVKLTIKDNAAITAFIHAPFADAKSISSNTINLDRKIAGGLWVRSWDSSASTNQLPIIQAGNWNDFGISKVEQPSQLSPVSYWHRSGN